jgi:hypothetical protein
MNSITGKRVIEALRGALNGRLIMKTARAPQRPWPAVR